MVGYYAPDQRVKPSDGLGHRGGVLRDLIQDPACGLPRIPILRTWVNRSGLPYLRGKDSGYVVPCKLGTVGG